MVYEYMIPVYTYPVKAGSRDIEGLPEQYRLRVAEFMAAQIELQ